MRVTVSDIDVFTIWECSDCGDRVEINPDWFQQNGTPVCCDMDMQYMETQISNSLLSILDRCIDGDCPIDVEIKLHGIPDIAPPVCITAKRCQYVRSQEGKEQHEETNITGLTAAVEKLVNRAREL